MSVCRLTKAYLQSEKTILISSLFQTLDESYWLEKTI